MIKFILNNTTLILAGLLVVLSLGWLKSCSDLREAKEELEEKKAYISAVEDNQAGVATILNMTKAELEISKDSINMLMDSLIEAKKYTKTIVRTEYIESKFEKADSVMFSDTIFKEDLCFDTVIGDNKYYSCTIVGEYPNKLIITPKVNSELVILTHTEKDYTGKPAKTKVGVFLRKIFCRSKWREKYVNDIEDLNPYITVKTSRTIQIKED